MDIKHGAGRGGEPSREATVQAQTDIDITQHVLDTLAFSGRVNPANVSATSNHGVVTLNGVVPMEAERAAAELIARSVPGVADVVNQIVVAGRGTGPTNATSRQGDSQP